MLYFDIVNQSTVVTDSQLQIICAAIEMQVRNDFAPIWGVGYALSIDLKKKPVKSSKSARHMSVFVMDDSDVQGALGYHDVDEVGNPLGKVFARTDQKYGLKLSVTMSHEILEMLGDFFCTDGVQTDPSTWYAREMCDAVEADALGYDIVVSGNTVTVSDFITPEWFKVGSDGPWDFKDHLKKPLTLMPGGYCSLWSASTGWIQHTAQASPDAVSRVVTSSRHAARVAKLLKQALPATQV